MARIPFLKGRFLPAPIVASAREVPFTTKPSPVCQLNRVRKGWAQATCTGPVQASLLYRLYTSGTPTGEASVSAETTTNHRVRHVHPDGHGDRLRKSFDHAIGYGYGHGVQRLWNETGQQCFHAGTNGARIGQRRPSARPGNFHRICQDHFHKSHHQPVAERRSLPGILFVAPRRST